MNFSQEVIDYVHRVADQFSGLNADPNHPGYRDELDAFRHAYMSALLARAFGQDIAKLAMSEYERQHPNTDPNLTPEERAADSEADEFNNLVGRNVAYEWLENRNGMSLEEAVYNAVKEGRTINDPANDPRRYTDPGFSWDNIRDAVSTLYHFAQNWRQLFDPLTLDLDGDGLETVGIDPNAPILFDHDGDGVKSATGWIHPDDGLLVLDRNGNGVIDNGSELFGDSTVIPDGSGGSRFALDGFEALSAEDTNNDGRVDANDANFSHLRVWRDQNQDGISQGNELATLAELNITAINTAKTENTTALLNGTVIADLGTYIRDDGTQGTTGEIAQLGDVDFPSNSFYNRFPDILPITPEAQLLPDMQGSGLARSLREAASIGSAEGQILYNALTNFRQTRHRFHYCSKSTTRVRRMAASRVRMRSEGLPIPRSICETYVRSTPASSASPSWENPNSRRRRLTLADSLRRKDSKRLSSMPGSVPGPTYQLHGI